MTNISRPMPKGASISTTAISIPTTGCRHDWQCAGPGIQEIRRNLLRAGLTTLGIVIGVAAVIAMVTLGNGASESVTSSIASLGRNLVIIQPGTRRGFGGGGLGVVRARFRRRGCRNDRRSGSNLRAVAPVSVRNDTVVAGQSEPSDPDHGNRQRLFLRRATGPIAEGRASLPDGRPKSAAAGGWCVFWGRPSVSPLFRWSENPQGSGDQGGRRAVRSEWRSSASKGNPPSARIRTTSW